MTAFTSLKLSHPIVKALETLGFTEPTPIQSRAIPLLLAGQDLLAIAQTGTGKTAAFGLPILEALAQKNGRAEPKRPHVLILAPTRELAAQIHNAFTLYAQFLMLRSTLIVGGVAFGPQVRALEAGTDIVVATPGRLMDLTKECAIELSNVRYCVLDEADRMLDMGFVDDITKILRMCPDERQTMLFSATFSPDIRRLAQSLLVQPQFVEIEPNRDVAKITQRVYQVAKPHKREFLRDLVVDNQWRQVLVFTRLKSTAARLAVQLEKDGFTVDCIHGDRTQSARSKALTKFKAGEVQILVATDVVARGIDIKELPHVVNFDLPTHAEDYVHRIGRTGRAGMDGEAVSLMAADERVRLEAIERLLKKKFEVTVIDEAADGDEVIEVTSAERFKTRAKIARERRPMRSAAQEKVRPARSPSSAKNAPSSLGATRKDERRTQQDKKRAKLEDFDYVFQF